MFRINIFCHLAEEADHGYIRCPVVRLNDYNDEWSDDEFSYQEYDYKDEASYELSQILGNNPALFYNSNLQRRVMWLSGNVYEWDDEKEEEIVVEEETQVPKSEVERFITGGYPW